MLPSPEANGPNRPRAQRRALSFGVWLGRRFGNQSNELRPLFWRSTQRNEDLGHRLGVVFQAVPSGEWQADDRDAVAL
ncbi:hypothetical protein GCM10011415_27220 [Salipiger pallidus]|uniref:Uncharacterized protein n=1 Tax=Salipiger pallidus TaxID=1775170 RepID=A0A8J2ZKV0_9RHOB|nr:hypothetical protein GCM10011415_27220 [Salipiger pallidus]